MPRKTLISITYNDKGRVILDLKGEEADLDDMIIRAMERYHLETLSQRNLAVLAASLYLGIEALRFDFLDREVE
jgi:hypothetical protein